MGGGRQVMDCHDDPIFTVRTPPTPPHPVPLGRRVTSREASPPRRARASRGVGLSASPRAALLLPAAERRRESVVSPPFFPNIVATLAGPY